MMGVARFTGVVPLLLLLLLLLYRCYIVLLGCFFEIQRRCGLELVLVVFKMAR